MRYSRQHKERTRQRIIDSACRLFVARGYGATSIEDIMRDCGLTRGAFYAHFGSKGRLYRDAIGHAALRGGGDDWIESLSRLAFFAADAAREEPEVRSAYTQAFKSMSERILGAEGSILPTMAMMIGALAIARTTDDAALKAKLLASCKANARALLERNGADAAPSFFWEPVAN